MRASAGAFRGATACWAEWVSLPPTRRCRHRRYPRGVLRLPRTRDRGMSRENHRLHRRYSRRNRCYSFRRRRRRDRRRHHRRHRHHHFCHRRRCRHPHGSRRCPRHRCHCHRRRRRRRLHRRRRRRRPSRRFHIVLRGCWEVTSRTRSKAVFNGDGRKVKPRAQHRRRGMSQTRGDATCRADVRGVRGLARQGGWGMDCCR